MDLPLEGHLFLEGLDVVLQVDLAQRLGLECRLEGVHCAPQLLQLSLEVSHLRRW